MALSSSAANACGWVGAILSMISVIPQVLQAAISRSIDDVSVVMYFLLIFSNVLWLTYGIGLNSWQLVMSVVIQLSSGIVVTGYKLAPLILNMFPAEE